MSITSEQISQQIAQILALTEANTLTIAALQQQQSISQQQIDSLRSAVADLRENQAIALQRFCTEQQAASSEFRSNIDATLARLERTLDCILADTENQGNLIQEVKEISLRLALGRQDRN